ncbi:MAG: bifunctional tetrahydrofolate synthase/dihydrofolate synthase [Gammaproteobacteria bacterium]
MPLIKDQPAGRSRPRYTALCDWLAWQEGLHVREIDLGLERCQSVKKRMGLAPPAYRVIAVGGTNGKGSSVAFLDAILRTAGYRVATYTSPHLLCYNERIRIQGEPVSDRQLCAAFERVDAARGATSLTYFEFGTLAALSLCEDAELDIAVLEVGLGGRLDAVNVVDADVALITAIGIDHVEWLGPDRSAIAFEKAGIFRPARGAVCSDPEVPQSLIDHAGRLGTRLSLLGRDYRYSVGDGSWSWASSDSAYCDLPAPGLMGDYQYQNAAGVLRTIEVLCPDRPVPEPALREGLAAARLPGRFQIVTAGGLEYVLDVAHNPQAAEVLARTLRQHRSMGRRTAPAETHAIFGMLRDKDRQGFLTRLQGLVDHWHVTGLPGSRGTAASLLAREVAALSGRGSLACYDSAEAALRGAQARARHGDRVLVTGSFLTVAGVLRSLP